MLITYDVRYLLLYLGFYNYIYLFIYLLMIVISARAITISCVYSNNYHLFVHSHLTNIEIGLQIQLRLDFMIFIESQLLNIKICFTL